MQSFVHRFETNNHKYLFDVNSGRILRCDSVTWEIIEDVGKLSLDEIVAKYKRKHKPSVIEKRYLEILRTQKKRQLLLTRYHENMSPPIKGKKAEEAINRLRNKLTLSVTEKCNYRCSYCLYGDKYRNRRMHSNRSMTWMVAKRAIDDFLEHSQYYRQQPDKQRTIGFYGGEALLNLELIKKCVLYVKKRGKTSVRFQVTTNGSLLSGDTAAFLAAEEFNLCVSLDGPREIHDQNRKRSDGSPTWDVVMENIADFLNTYPDYKTNGLFNINCVFFHGVDVKKVAEFFASTELFSQGININADYQVNLGWNQSNIDGENQEPVNLDILSSEFSDWLISGDIAKNPGNPKWRLHRSLFDLDYYRIHSRKVATGYRRFPQSLFGAHSMCIPGVQKLYVAVDGSYYPCERVPNTSKLKIGDVSKGLDQCKAEDLMERFYEYNLDQCRECWCAVNCAVGCAVDIISNGDIAESVKKEQCDMHRGCMHYTIQEYCRILELNEHAFDYLETMELV